MVRKKKEPVLTELLGSFGYLIRHRSGLNLFNKSLDRLNFKDKVIYLDNKIPALIQDVFNNLDYEQKDGQKPVIAAKRKTEYGWHLIINLPPGVSFSQVKKDKEFFQDATNSWVELEWKYGKAHMNVQVGELGDTFIYEWDPSKYLNMVLPIPIGYSRKGLHVLDLAESPHFLIGGTTGFGKTSMIASIIHSVLSNAIVVIIDLKGIDFEYLRERCIVAKTNVQAAIVLMALNQEFERRRDIICKYRVRKAINCPEALPYIVLVVDELMELNKDNFVLLDRLVRLARATSISVIGASQRTSTSVIPGDTRANFLARACFKVPSPADCRVIMGEDCGLAADLPSIKGRCIYRYGIDTMELQTMYLSEKHAEELALKTNRPSGEWEVNFRDAKHSTKKLTPK